MRRRKGLVLLLLAVALSGLVVRCMVIEEEGGGVSMAPDAPQPGLDELTALCSDGTPISKPGPYAGPLHPLAIVSYDAVEDNPGWVWGGIGGSLVSSTPEFTAFYAVFNHNDPVQLVACRTRALGKLYQSCGTYTRSDGVAGEVFIVQKVDTIRVVSAATGATLESRVFEGDVADSGDCSSSYTAPATSPPWREDGGPLPDDTAEAKYLTEVGTRPVSP
jgi:hypothetical protein